ncbi:MAG: hypothetical protein ABI781_19480 [Burkholderiales bacterium]
MQHLHPQTLCLPRGGTRLCRASAGTELIATRGSVRLTERCRQVADHLVSRTTRLDSGERHRIDEDGWITLRALDDCELRFSPPASIALADLWPGLRRIIAGLGFPRSTEAC